MSDKLLPCPFCGGAPEISSPYRKVAICTTCAARGPIGDNPAEGWNSRAQPAPSDHVVGIELNGVAEQLADGAGAWRSCSGCHNLNEGHPTGPWSDVLKCHLGMGCFECGGIGAIWDNTDYSDYGKEESAPADQSTGVTLTAKTVIAIRDALIGDSIEEAYHQLYKAVDPDFLKLKPWAEIETALSSATPEDQS